MHSDVNARSYVPKRPVSRAKGSPFSLPRFVWVIAGEVTGACSIFEEPRKQSLWTRLRALASAGGAKIRAPLFDREYYLRNNGDVARSWWPPLLHFLFRGGFEGRSPHPMFDAAWYRDRYADVASSKFNPLQHYMTFGGWEGRGPHPLFDGRWYLERYPEVKSSTLNPAVHFLQRGGFEGRQPHPQFDTVWYVEQYPQVRQAGVNPLVHYLSNASGGAVDPNPYFRTGRYLQGHPQLAASGVNPLVHFLSGADTGAYNLHPTYHRDLTIVAGSGVAGSGRDIVPRKRIQPRRAPKPVLSNSLRPGEELPVFVVYGKANVPFVERSLIPALAAQQSAYKFHLHVLHYANAEGLLSSGALTSSGGSLRGVTDWSGARENRRVGFGEAVNELFRLVAPANCFYLVNPDAMPMANCMDRLASAFVERGAALVEARQWPSEHPKEYDADSHETPWASAAFLLVSSEAFRRLGGFDPVYFLYNEDVDLSWRAWLGGMPVIYEPRARCAHFTGLFSYNRTRLYYENFFGIRNSLVIAYKFFGKAGERSVWKLIREAGLPGELLERIESSYQLVRGEIRSVDMEGSYNADRPKILGLNIYHDVRPTQWTA